MNNYNWKIKQQKYNMMYMDLAERIAQMSYSKRLKVGSVLVKDQKIISFGWNGMPSGFDNNCEFINEITGDLVTRPEVLHSEANCLMKLAKSTESSENAELFITHSPCIECSKMIHQSGIKSIFFKHRYRDDSGIKFLQKANLYIEEIKTDG